MRIEPSVAKILANLPASPPFWRAERGTGRPRYLTLGGKLVLAYLEAHHLSFEKVLEVLDLRMRADQFDEFRQRASINDPQYLRTLQKARGGNCPWQGASILGHVKGVTAMPTRREQIEAATKVEISAHVSPMLHPDSLIAHADTLVDFLREPGPCGHSLFLGANRDGFAVRLDGRC